MPKTRPLEERFWEKVDKRGPDECWEWMASKMGKGYGVIGAGHDGKMLYAHRLSWTIHYGPIPEGMCVLHRYDNRSCVNPRHLFLGTHTDNVYDMCIKGRQARGENIGIAKLTVQQVCSVPYLVAQGYTQSAIAQEFNVCESTIRAIITGKSWGWLLKNE